MILLLLACGGVKDAELVVSDEIPTVATLSYSASFDSTVRFGAVDGRQYTTPVQACCSSSLPLVGVPANTTIEYAILDPDGNERYTGTYETGNLADELPSLDVTGGDMDSFVATPMIGSPNVATIIDPDGNIVWWWFEERELDVYRVRLAENGSGVIFNAGSVSGDPAEDSELMKVSWDGSSVTPVPVEYLAHDFVEHEDGTIDTIAVDFREGSDGETIRGDQILEIKPDGTQTSLWSTWDCFDPELNPGDEPKLGWTWVNALDYDAAADQFHISVHNFSSIVWIGRSTGTCDRIVGGDLSDYTFDGDTFRHEHQFEVLPDGNLLVFDNDGLESFASRAIEYELDDSTMTATEVWNYTPEPSLFSFVLGDVARFEDGRTFVMFSTSGTMVVVEPDGTTVDWQLTAPAPTAFGFASLYEDLYK